MTKQTDNTHFYVGRSLLYALELSVISFFLAENLLRWNDYELWLPNDWLSVLLNRVLDSNYCLFILAIFAVLFFYGLLQILGVSIDRMALIPKNESWLLSRGLKIFGSGSLMAGRPPMGTVPSTSQQTPNTYQEQRDISYDIFMAPLSFGIWLMPLLGFIGTIIGISGAIAELPKIRNQEDNLSSVLGNLYIAFDTTFLGLICAICLAVILFIIRLRWRTIDYYLLGITTQSLKNDSIVENEQSEKSSDVLETKVNNEG
jgi:hypothetical protein